MMRLRDDEIAEPVARARRFAALSGSFDPRSLVDVLGTASADVVLGVTADLADACDTGGEGGAWLMRPSVRRRELDHWATEGELDEAIEWRRTLPLDDATEDLLDALVGSGAYAQTAVQEAVAGDAERDTLNRIAVALDRAGDLAPAHGALESVRSALGRLDARARSDAMLSRGFFGREYELVQIADWLGQTATSPPVTTLFISGLPGIGKSTLVDEAARRAASAEPQFLVVRLDFDRSGLDVQDRVGLTMEVSRQVSIGLGDEAATLQQARIVAAGATATSAPAVKGEGRREHVPDKLSSILGGVVARAGRPILMILDTMEVLRGRGETHPGRLFDCLDELCVRGLRPLAVIAAGRGDALDSAHQRIGDRIELAGLDPADAEAMLTRLEVPPAAFATIHELAEGNPLVLRLAALAVREAGPEALKGVRGRREVAAAYLYRFLLSRIGDPKLRDLAEPGLVVRRINPDVIAEVLAPVLRLKLQPGEAVTLFEALATHHWLVEPDPTPGWVRHRSDIRTVLLRLLYGYGSKRTAARIDRAAAKWFAGRTEPFAAMEAAYHQLQAMRGGGEPPSIDPEVIRQLDQETIAELPEEAQDLIRTVRGERTSKFRAVIPTAAPIDHAAAANELEALLERGDIYEASFVYDRAFANQRLEPWSPEADIARTFLWRAGRWREATKELGRQRFVEDGQDIFSADRSPLCVLALLEIWAELRFSQLVSEFERDPSLAEYAVRTRGQGIKGSLANGALGFALLRAGMSLPSSAGALEDPVGAAAIVWSQGRLAEGPGSQGSRDVLDVLARPSSRFASLVSERPPAVKGGRRRRSPDLPDPLSPAGAARLLATSSPYGSAAEALRVLGRDERILSHLSRVDFDLAETGALPPSGAGKWSVERAVSPEGSIDNIAALGLLAEWLGAAAFVLRHPDLRLIARSAERWRRTTADHWAYPRPLRIRGWSRRPDATTADRSSQLLQAVDPVAASRDQLRLWWGGEHDAAPDPAERIAGRFPAAMREARTRARRGDALEAAESVAIALLERNVPSAFVPPLAVLISMDRLEGRSSR